MKKKTLFGLLTIVMFSVLTAFCFTACTTRVQNVHLNFVVEGETISTIETSGKDAVSIPNNPEKEGYTFDGWYWDKDIWSNAFTANSLLNAPISSDMSVYAKLTPIQYSITYNLDGGINTNPTSYTIETSTITLSNAEKEGYTFNGWYKESSFSNEVKSIANGSTGNIELYAKYTINQYTISFNVNGGNSVASLTQDYKSSVSAPSEPLKSGYDFGGWYLAGSETAYSFSTMPAEDITLNAKWIPIEYSISYNLSDGTNGENPAKYTIETNTITLANPTREGYIFNGWYKGETKVEKIEKGTTGDITLTAQWTPIEYTITYENTKSADNNNPNKFTIESDTITLVNLEKLGYTFNGWYNGSNKVTEIVAGTIGNITLTADWTVNGYEITYHNVNGSTNNNPDVYNVEDEPLTLLNASKVGYTFIGWYTDSEFKNEISVITVGTIGDKNLYAKWEIVEYTASFKVDNNLIEDVIFTVETENLIEPTVPNKIGYNGNWESYVLVASNITINAVYTPIIYSITYNNTKDRPNSNPVEYNIEDNTITLVNLSATGYIFDGWYEGTNKVETITAGSYGDITLTANWTVIEYTLTLDYDETLGEYATSSSNPTKYTIESDFVLTVLESKVIGVAFDGWFTAKNDGEGEKISAIAPGRTGNLTLYAHWGLETYTITYHNVEGLTNTNATTYTIQTEEFTISELSKIGYSFSGWYMDEAFQIEATTTIVKGSNGNLDFYAKWTPIDYTISYTLYGGMYESGSNPETYTIEDTVNLISPKLIGYVFDGWYTASEGGTKVTTIAMGTTGNLSLYAHWIYISTITFDSKGGSQIASISNAAGMAVSAPNQPTRDYYTFAGWYCDENCVTEYKFTVMPQEDITIYANWTPIEYNITYVLNGGTNANTNPQTYTVEDAFTLAEPVKIGNTFIAWFTDAQFTSNVVTGIIKGTHGDIVLYASYSINQYTISFDSNGGTSVEPITQNYATNVSAPSSPAKNGYNFAGWYSDSALKNIYNFTTMPAENITLYAKWSLANYNIVYHLSGGTNNAQNPATYTIESNTINFAAPTNRGYEFAGWYSDNEYTNTITKIEKGSYGNIEVYAKWNIIAYSVMYIMPENALNTNTTTYTVESDIVNLEDASLVGNTFNGWYSDSTYTNSVTTIAGGEIGNITLYAKFTPNTYTIWMDGKDEARSVVSFNLNGASSTAPASQTITETNTLIYPTIPTRSGYLFGGWYDNAVCDGNPYDFTAMISGDITLYAKWVAVGNANAITVGNTASVMLSGKTDMIYKFIPLVSGNVTITTIGSYDTLGSLYYNETLLKQDDDSGADSNFLIVYNVTAGEVYEIRVRGFSASASGTVTLSVNGNTTVATGGYTKTGNKTTVTFGDNFTLQLPQSQNNYKFLGWQDADGVLYTDANGNSIRVWDKAENTLLVSKWERMEYSVTFVTNGGSSVEAVTLEYGARLDLNQYVTTRNNYTFSGWYLSASDTESYNATTMPDHNITLYAKWTTFALGAIKYDEDKKAISINDTISAELFDAICLDTNGKPADFAVTVNGAQTVGNSISVRLVATSGGKTKQVTITNVKVYDAPTLTITTPKDYVNLADGLYGEWFGASGTDTFGEETEIKVRIEGNYSAGDIATIIIDSIDLAGNITSQSIENVKLYGNPEITIANTNIKVSDGVTIASLGATACDSFGESAELTIIDENSFVFGEVYSHTTSTSYDYKYFTATNTGTYKLYYKNGSSSKRTYLYVYCESTGSVVYNGSSYVTNTSYSSINLSVVEGYQYYIRTYAYSASYTTDFSMYIQGASKITGDYEVIVSATDGLGNKTEQTVFVKIYAVPTISSTSVTEFRVEDNITVESLGLSAVDTYDQELEITLSIKNGTQTAGSVLTYVATAVDMAGNIAQKEVAVKIYGTPIINYDRTAIKVNENAAAKYVVSFNLNGGEGSIPSQTVTSIRGLTYTDIPTRSGYVFRGWFTSSDCATLFDFSASVTKDTIVYAGWQAMASSYYSREIIDIVSDHNSSDNAHSFSSTGTSSSNYHYTYFTALTSGTYRVYYKNDSTNSNYTIYAYIYNMTKGSVVKSNAGVTSTSYNYYSVTANAGDVIYIRTYRTNTNYSSTFSLYVTGGELPEAGGTVSNYISVSAEDSFGISLPVTIELKSGALTSGTYVVYTLTATDKLGNVSVVDTIPIGVYDVNDISFTYMNMASDIIKLTSKGEEFFAEATDSFGNACDITIEVAEGYVLSGGKIVSLYIVATDKAGNRVESDLISNIKVYDIPTVKLTDESKGYTIAEDGDLSFLFVASDSFGEELYVDITTQDTVTAGNIITVQVVAEDIAGNVLTTYFDIAVYAAQKPYVELIIEDVLWKGFYADGLQQIEVPTDWRLPFIGWSDADGNIYADENGNLLQTLSPYIRLYATSDFAPIDTVQQLKDIKIDGQYILFNDLSLSGVSWTSIGTESSPFIGVFDGNGHRITSLEFTNGSGRGLFAYSSGTIKNLTLSVYFSYVSGSGGLVVNNSGLIENCKVMGTITAGSNSTEGGIVCTNYATGIIRNSSSSVKVTAYGYVGGVAAINNGTITHCSASGTIQGGYFNSSSSSAEGGLVGSNTGSIECSYATGEISGGMYSGGLVGSSSKGSIINCYATGSVKGDTAGGLIGSNGGSVTNCYASGKVTASIGRSGGTNNYVYAYGGGLIGRNSGTVTRCFATGDVTVSASATGATNCGATAYAGGLIGSESGTSTSCYRASTQTVTATKTIPSGTSDGTITETGTSYTISSIISSIRSSWGSTYWNFSSTSNPPTLK